MYSTTDTGRKKSANSMAAMMAPISRLSIPARMLNIVLESGKIGSECVLLRMLKSGKIPSMSVG
jgi:hypothetical protein